MFNALLIFENSYLFLYCNKYFYVYFIKLTHFNTLILFLLDI